MNSVSVSIGHTVNLSLSFFDLDNIPVTKPVAPDSPPVWSNTSPIAALDVATGGMTAVEKPIGVGTDTINVFVLVAGVVLHGHLSVVISDIATAPHASPSVMPQGGTPHGGPQRVATVQIIASVN